MKCNNIHKDLIFYLDNDLSAEKKSAVEKHLEECAECRSFFAFLKDELQVIEKEKNPPTSPFFYTRLSVRLDQKTIDQTKSKWLRLVQPAFFSLLLILGIYGGLRLGSNASLPELKHAKSNNIQIINDFESEPIEYFLLDEL